MDRFGRVSNGAAQSAGVTVPRAAGWLNRGSVSSQAGSAGLLGSPDPRSVSGHDVDLHPHQPDPPDQCGRSTNEASREALRNRLLQKQSRGLAERRVSDTLPLVPGRSW